MSYKKTIFSLFFYIVTGLTSLFAQQTISATGGNAVGSGGSVSYTVGQVFYTSVNGTNGKVAQGVQQAFEISSPTGLEPIKGINLSYTVYPNPTSDYLILNIDASTTVCISSINYQLFDLKGNLLESKPATGYETQIKMNGLAASTYFLKVTERNKVVKTFKIIKN